MTRQSDEFLPLDERVEEALKILRPQPRRFSVARRHVRKALDTVENARHRTREDPLVGWKDELRDGIKALERVQQWIKRARPKMHRPKLIDELDFQCVDWIERCRGQLLKALLPGVEAARRPRRHEGDVGRHAAAQARFLLEKYGRPRTNEHKLARILFGN